MSGLRISQHHKCGDSQHSSSHTPAAKVSGRAAAQAQAVVRSGSTPQPGQQRARARRGRDYATPPLGQAEVDHDLWAVLDLASDGELAQLHAILHGASPFSPVLKTLLADNEPAAAALRGRPALMHRVESRFRFLAASTQSLVRGHRPSYRDALLAVRDRLQVDCPTGLSLEELEAEIYSHVLEHHHPAVEGVAEAIEAEKTSADSLHRRALSVLRSPLAWGQMARGGLGMLNAPLTWGGPDLLPSAAKLGSASAFRAASPKVLGRLAAKVAIQSRNYDVALAALCRQGGQGLRQRAAMQAAQAGLSRAAGRLGAMQGALAVLQPLLLAWVAVDLAGLALGTDYARLVRCVVAVAQVRLLRTYGFVSP